MIGYTLPLQPTTGRGAFGELVERVQSVGKGMQERCKILGVVELKTKGINEVMSECINEVMS